MIHGRIFRRVILPAFCISAVAGLVCVLCFPPSFHSTGSSKTSNQASIPSTRQVITLHNATSKMFSYLIKPLYEGIFSEERTLKPGAVERFTKGIHLEIIILPEETGLMYWLFPGEDYSVQDLAEAGLRIFPRTGTDSETLRLAPFVPSPMKAVHHMLETAGIDRDSVVFDLGCGDGRVVIEAARKYGARGVGIDIDPQLIRIARFDARKAGVESRVEFHVQDIFDADISTASVVYLYLYRDSNHLLRPFLEAGLKPGTLVACLNFMIPGWENRLVSSNEVPTEDDVVNNIIYLYQR